MLYCPFFFLQSFWLCTWLEFKESDWSPHLPCHAFGSCAHRSCEDVIESIHNSLMKVMLNYCQYSFPFLSFLKEKANCQENGKRDMAILIWLLLNKWKAVEGVMDPGRERCYHLNFFGKLELPLNDGCALNLPFHLESYCSVLWV
jgi:hypothetical protein